MLQGIICRAVTDMQARSANVIDACAHREPGARLQGGPSFLFHSSGSEPGGHWKQTLRTQLQSRM